MRIAVLDAGFANAMILEAFDSLYAENRMVDAYDFVHNDTNVYDGGGGHGTSVLSTMAALNSGVMTGVAPHAEYALYTTEDVSSETRQEEYNWVFGSERADSLGCDIINTSLGYYEMDDPNESYTYEDMDGNTTVITRAADIAASRGLIVAASAGNTGFSSWQRIVAPCDGDSVFCVGGTNLNGVYVAFSGRGPSADGRVKPNVVGAAAGVTVLTGSDVPTAGNGTSFSSPVMAGLLACVWQKFPFKNNVEVMQAVELISDQQYAPDSLRGYGLPNFQHIDWALSSDEPQMTMMDAEVFPNPTSGELRVHCAACEEAIEWKLYDLTGKARSVGRTPSIGAIQVESPAGVYVLQLVSGQQQRFVRLIKE